MALLGRGAAGMAITGALVAGCPATAVAAAGATGSADCDGSAYAESARKHRIQANDFFMSLEWLSNQHPAKAERNRTDVYINPARWHRRKICRPRCCAVNAIRRDLRRVIQSELTGNHHTELSVAPRRRR